MNVLAIMVTSRVRTAARGRGRSSNQRWCRPVSNAALADRWNGTAWVIQRIAQPPKGWTPVFSGVSCTSARACTAVGDRYRQDGQRLTLAERWNGTTWVIQPT